MIEMTHKQRQAIEMLKWVPANKKREIAERYGLII